MGFEMQTKGGLRDIECTMVLRWLEYFNNLIYYTNNTNKLIYCDFLPVPTDLFSGFSELYIAHI